MLTDKNRCGTLYIPNERSPCTVCISIGASSPIGLHWPVIFLNSHKAVVLMDFKVYGNLS